MLHHNTEKLLLIVEHHTLGSIYHNIISIRRYYQFENCGDSCYLHTHIFVRFDCTSSDLGKSDFKTGSRMVCYLYPIRPKSPRHQQAVTRYSKMSWLCRKQLPLYLLVWLFYHINTINVTYRRSDSRMPFILSGFPVCPG